LKVIIIPIFTVYEEEGILQVFIHWRAITDSAERTILTANDNVSATIRLGPITEDNDCDFVSCWEVSPTPIMVLARSESN